MVVDAPPDMLADRRLADLLDAAPCDVAVVVTPVGGDGAGDEVFVPFTGADHDWSAVEIGVWIAQATGCSLRIAGPAEPDHDSSRLLASASLAIQRGYGVAVSSTLVEPSPEALSAAAHDAAMVVAGLSDRWKARVSVPPERRWSPDAVSPSCWCEAGFGPVDSPREPATPGSPGRFAPRSDL